jgi:hypothetical protein
MSAMLDSYYAQTGALRPNRNKAYNGRTVGVWSANETQRGTASAVDGALSLVSRQEQFAATTRVTPSIMGGAVLEFEGRSATGNHVSVQWTSSSQPAFGQPQMAAVPLSKDWTPCRVEMPFAGRIDQIRFVLRDAGWQADLRHVRLLTPDGTRMTEYEFY